MSIVSSCTITNPYGKTDECAQFTIDDLTTAFTFNDIMIVDKDYTFSFWVKSEAEGNVIVGGSSFATSTEWAQYSTTFKAVSTDLYMPFGAVGTYYIYHPQLESGTLATDWTPAPEDVDEDITGASEAASNAQQTADDNAERVSTVEASLQILADSVITRVTDENGDTTVLEQAGTGWVFSLDDLEKSVSEALTTIAALSEDQASVLLAIDALKGSVGEHGELTDYITISTYNNQPCIELGEVGGDFKLRITNTEMYFIAGSAILTTITNQKMIAEKIEVIQELQQGSFVWMLHGDGNLGLLWKGGST